MGLASMFFEPKVRKYKNKGKMVSRRHLRDSKINRNFAVTLPSLVVAVPRPLTINQLACIVTDDGEN